MKNALIGSIVGGIILFVWQFLSWGVLNLHGANMQYTPQQDEVLECLSEHLEPGSYFLPTVAPNASAEDRANLQASMAGQPWALVSYRPSFEMNMSTMMIRSFAVNIVIVYLLIWILMKMDDPSFSSILLTSVSIGVIGYLIFPYLNSVWFEGSTIGAMIDGIVPWAILGAWLGFWLRR